MSEARSGAAGDPVDCRCGDRYKEKVKDYNFGSLIRTDSRLEYEETNTIFGEHAAYRHQIFATEPLL